MKKYEYKEFRNIKTEALIKLANAFGQEGWELVYVRGGNNFLFKREISHSLEQK